MSLRIHDLLCVYATFITGSSLLQIPVSAVSLTGTGVTTLTLPTLTTTPQITLALPPPTPAVSSPIEVKEEKSTCVTEQCGNNQVHCQVCSVSKEFFIN